VAQVGPCAVSLVLRCGGTYHAVAHQRSRAQLTPLLKKGYRFTAAAPNRHADSLVP
jgi:hypothetical protein